MFFGVWGLGSLFVSSMLYSPFSAFYRSLRVSHCVVTACEDWLPWDIQDSQVKGWAKGRVSIN